jgi:hypothetical protein
MGEKIILDFLNFFEAKYDFLKIRSKIWKLNGLKKFPRSYLENGWTDRVELKNNASIEGIISYGGLKKSVDVEPSYT